MKSLPLAAAAAMFCLPIASAAPRVVISTPSLAPESLIELIFDQPVIPTSKIGVTEPNSWLEIQPPLPGKLLWKSPTSATLQLDAPPAIATDYRFTLRNGHTYTDGVPIPAGLVNTVSTEAFQFVRSFVPSRWDSNYDPSIGSLVVVFNDVVHPAAAATFISFTSAEKASVAAIIDRPNEETVRSQMEQAIPWNQRGAFRSATAPSDNEVCPVALRIRPATPLPPSKEWRLTLAKGIANKSATAITREPTHISIGEIKPFRIRKIQAVVETDLPRTITVDFSHLLPKTLSADFLSRFVQITPMPNPLTVISDDRTLVLKGDFSEKQYEVSILPGVVSRSGHLLQSKVKGEIQFEHLKPQVALPSDNVGQLACGTRQYRIYTRNLSSLNLQVKQLSGINLVRAFQGYRHVSGYGPNYTNIRPTAPLPSALIVGKNLFERSIPLDRPMDSSHIHTLRWDDLLPANTRHAVMFLNANGTANPLCESSQSVTAQSVVQLTDIGLAWKFRRDEALVHAFSCETGTPLANVKISLFGEDATEMASSTTDANGLATLPRSPANRHLLATHGADEFITEFDANPATVGLWHFPVRYSWREPSTQVRRLFWFTDRSLYRPGETLRLKGILRDQNGNEVVPPKTSPARISISDPTEKEIFTTPVTFSPMGSFDFTFSLPPEKVGTHTIKLLFTDEIREAEAIPEDGDRWNEREERLEQARFELPVRVAYFRRNAFDTNLAIQTPEIAASRITASLKAVYFQGAPVAAGKVAHSTQISSINPYPKRFRDFLFGDHRKPDWQYWYHYFAFEDSENRPSEHTTPVLGETSLDPSGQAEISFDLPVGNLPKAKSVRIRAEVTDPNLQTLTATAETIVHPASLYVGVSRLDRIYRVGETVPFKIVAVTPEGEPYPSAVSLTAKLSRKVNLPVRTEGEGGATTTENQTIEELVSTSQLTLDPAVSKTDGQALPLTPSSNGLHFLTLSGTDPQGKPFSTVCHFQVYGKNEFPWEYEDGLRIRLVAEKPSYRAGETARVLVLSPIEGTALVTIEREKVLRSFLTPIKASNPVLEIPLTADDAPNAYVSVLVIKGVADSSRAFPQPQLRLGYCELKIAPERETLSVSLPPNSTSHRPGDEVTITGKVMLASGKPAANAEVTFYAEDEGTLAVMGYQTPNPIAYFYEPRNLGVEAGISFENFIAENPEMQSFNTKGFFVGGGGDLSKLADLLRKRFDPCATWAPALATDPDGGFSHTFRLPDTLTRYRLIAVAHQGHRFGHAESAITAKKDLMLEVKTPRFANQSDAPVACVTVQNASTYQGVWQVRCQSDSRSGSSPCRPSGPDARQVSLAPGASATLEFPLIVDATGEAVLQWSATPVSLGNTTLNASLSRQLSDAMETRFPCQYPVPVIREVRSLHLAKSSAPTDLLAEIPRKLLDGQGSVTVDFAYSPLVGAAEAVDFLLCYPYGCVEQTTSSLLPWCAVEPLRQHIPAMASVPPEKVRSALQTGVDRLLSMQLTDGSFTYWPGGRDALPWATPYAGLGLVLAAHAGANVPQSAIDSLCSALIESLRGMAETTSNAMLEHHARALLVLSLANHPQPAYLNALSDRLNSLNPTTRAFLAAAMALSSPGQSVQSSAAKTILTAPAGVPLSLSPSDESSDAFWSPKLPCDAILLLAWTAIDPQASQTQQALDRLLHERNPYGHWDTTWANAWSLLAVSRLAPHLPSQGESTVTLTTSNGSETITLSPHSGTISRSFPLSPELKCTASAPEGSFVRLSLASRPAVAPLQPIARNGLSIDRIHELILPDGSITPLAQPKPGDLIRTTLRVTLPNDGTRYLVIDDPLPSLFETVDTTFASQAPANTKDENQNWQISHSELRDDRAVFFVDHVRSRGTYTVSYLCRCTLPGKAIAPQAKVESMYDPSNYALSASRDFDTDQAAPK